MKRILLLTMLIGMALTLSAAGKYQLVTSDADIKADEEYLIVSQGTYGERSYSFAMGKVSANGGQRVTQVTVHDNHTITEIPQDALIVRLEGTSGKWKLKTVNASTNGYITTTESGNLTIGNEGTENAIEVQANGAAVISVSNRSLQCNPAGFEGSGITQTPFNYYEGTQQCVRLYKLNTEAVTYNLVTNVAQLKEGSKVAIATNDGANNGDVAKTGGGCLYSQPASFTADGKLILNANVQVYVIEKNAAGNFYLKKDGADQYLSYISSSETPLEYSNSVSKSEATIIIEDGKYAKISFTGITARNIMHNNNADASKREFRNYSNAWDNTKYIKPSLYISPAKPEKPTLTVNGEAVTTAEVSVKIGETAEFKSKDASLMIVNGKEEDGDTYTIKFTEQEQFKEYTVIGRNDIGDSEALTVTFTLNPAPSTPEVTVNNQPVKNGDNVTVQPNDVMSVEVPAGVTVVCSKGDKEFDKGFPYTFTYEDYDIGNDGMVNATPVAYTFVASKEVGNEVLQSDPLTLNITVKEYDGKPYDLATSPDKIQEGKKYAIACHQQYNDKDIKVVMGNGVQEKYRVPINFDLNQDGTLTPNDQTLILSFEKVEGQENQWYIKTENYAENLGITYYFQGASSEYHLKLTTAKSSAYKYTISFEGNNVQLSSGNHTIMYNSTNGAERFTQYKTDDYNNNAAHRPVQLYVLENVEVETYAEFEEQCNLHPGRDVEVKFVKPLIITGHYGNQIWMKENGHKEKPIYAIYNKETFEDYLMVELAINRTFWNFKGKKKVEESAADKPIYIEITSIDAEYNTTREEENQTKTYQVPYFRDLPKDEMIDVPLFNDYTNPPEWWEFGQIYGKITTTDGITTITPEGGGTAFTVITDLPQKEYSPLTIYVRPEGVVWEAGDDSFFVDGQSTDPLYLMGAIMPYKTTEERAKTGEKAIAAMSVSGKQFTTSVEAVDADDAEAIVDVYNMQGIRLRSGVRRVDALRELPAGIYIVGGKKVLITQ